MIASNEADIACHNVRIPAPRPRTGCGANGMALVASAGLARVSLVKYLFKMISGNRERDVSLMVDGVDLNSLTAYEGADNGR